MCVQTLHYARHLSKNKYISRYIKLLKRAFEKTSRSFTTKHEKQSFAFYFGLFLTYSIDIWVRSTLRKSCRIMPNTRASICSGSGGGSGPPNPEEATCE